MSTGSEPGADSSLGGESRRLHARRLSAGGHAVDVRGTFDPVRPPIVLVHGIGASGEYFLPFAEALAAEYDVYAVDLPGYGTTPKPPRALSVAELGEVLAETITALGLAAPVVVGHSMGCQIVARTMLSHPGLCAGYVLIGPTVDPTARRLGAQGLRLLRDFVGEPRASNAVVLRNYLRMGPLRYLRTAQHMLADRIEETVPHLAAPGLVIHGGRDPIAPTAWVRQLARIAADASAVEVPGCPHALQHNRPLELAAACAPFLSAVAGHRGVSGGTGRQA